MKNLKMVRNIVIPIFALVLVVFLALYLRADFRSAEDGLVSKHVRMLISGVGNIDERVVCEDLTFDLAKGNVVTIEYTQKRGRATVGLIDSLGNTIQADGEMKKRGDRVKVEAPADGSYLVYVIGHERTGKDENKDCAEWNATVYYS